MLSSPFNRNNIINAEARIAKEKKENQQTLRNETENLDKYKTFYNDVEEIYNVVKRKQDLKNLLNKTNKNSNSIIESVGIDFGDTILIKANTKNDGTVNPDTITISKEETPTEKNITLDDFTETDSDDDDIEFIDDSTSTIQAVEPKESEGLTDFIKNIKKIKDFSSEIYNKIHSHYNNLNTKISKTDKHLNFIKAVDKVITIFLTIINSMNEYLMKIFGKIDSRYYDKSNYFDIALTNLQSKKKHFEDKYKEYNTGYELFKSNNNANYNDYINIIKKETEFLFVINEICNYLYEQVNEKKVLLEKEIQNNNNEFELYRKNINSLWNTLVIEKGDFENIYLDIFVVNSGFSKEVSTLRVGAALSSGLYGQPRNNSQPISNINKMIGPYTGKGISRGGSTRKINHMKKYTISRKVKNARLYKTRNRNIRNKNKTRINK